MSCTVLYTCVCIIFFLTKKFEDANLSAVISEVVSQTPAPTTHSAGLPPDAKVSSIFEIGFYSNNNKKKENRALALEYMKIHKIVRKTKHLEERRLVIWGDDRICEVSK